MNEEEWLNGTDAHELLQRIGGRATQRKLRVLACACMRHLLSLVGGNYINRLLNVAELFADGEPITLSGEQDAFGQPMTLPGWQRTETEECHDSRVLANRGEVEGVLEHIIHGPPYEAAEWALHALAGHDLIAPGFADTAYRAALVREVFGYPFRTVNFAPWRTDTAVSLARQMYDSRDFGAMPILADALQDAGCDHADVLDHCRSAGPHVRGCWVVDGVLGLA